MRHGLGTYTTTSHSRRGGHSTGPEQQRAAVSGHGVAIRRAFTLVISHHPSLDSLHGRLCSTSETSNPLFALLPSHLQSWALSCCPIDVPPHKSTPRRKARASPPDLPTSACTILHQHSSATTYTNSSASSTTTTFTRTHRPPRRHALGRNTEQHQPILHPSYHETLNRGHTTP